MEYERFGPYTVYERLGAGGMASVHRASIAIGGGVVREIALKRLLPQLADDKQFVEDFIREAKLAAQLHHPNIVHIHELGHAEGIYFIAMELVRGQPLTQLMKKARAARQTTPIGIVVALLAELCDALTYASTGRGIYGQALNIVHRDLTPSNLIVTDEGRLKIIDFGVAKALSGKFMTNTGLIKGKLGYMSVEALSGSSSLDARTDLFSLGVVAWELITGKRLFTGVNEVDVMMKIRSGDVPRPSSLNPDCPAELEGIVLKALHKAREDRWRTAAEIRHALDGLRRFYREGAAQVAAWKQSLIPVQPTEVRLDSQSEATNILSTRDLLTHTEHTLAEGSARRPSHSELVGPLPTEERTRNVRGPLHELHDDEPTHIDPSMLGRGSTTTD